jgi:hypothetical protein
VGVAIALIVLIAAIGLFIWLTSNASEEYSPSEDVTLEMEAREEDVSHRTQIIDNIFTVTNSLTADQETLEGLPEFSTVFDEGGIFT